MGDKHYCRTCGTLVCPEEENCQHGHVAHMCDDCEAKTRKSTTDLNALALALAGAKKPCPCRADEPCKYCYYLDAGFGTDEEDKRFKAGLCGGQCETPTCKSTGEVYVLGLETRVECKDSYCVNYNHPDWTPLDPRYLGDWMGALAKAGLPFVHIEPPVPEHDKWLAYSDTMRWHISYADTPGEAWFQVAMEALGLDTEEE